MDRHRFLVSYGGAVAFLSLIGLLVTGAPTSLVGVAMGIAVMIAAWPRWRGSLGLTIDGVLVGLLCLQSLLRLLRSPTDPADPFGQVFFAILAAMSLTALLVLLAGRPRTG